MIFETHAHYDDEKFDGDREELIAKLPEAGIGHVINVGASIESTKTTLELVKKHDFMYAAVGVHPSDVDGLNEETFAWLAEQTRFDKTVAVGEIGLDYYWDKEPEVQKNQRIWFQKQMELARELKKPVIIHEREACADVLDTVTQFKDIPGVYHCFSGSWETAKVILDQGWYLSFTGIITFKNARRALEVIEKMPADRLMIETDSPYLSPVPMRGTRNNSSNLKYTAQKAAEVRGISHEELAKLTLENGKRFFGIK